MKDQHKERYRRLKAKIGYYRRLAGITQETLAYLTKLDISTIGAIEAPNVERYPKLETIFDIADALDIPPYKFFMDD